MIVARGRAEALEVVGLSHPDLILLDVTMPGMDGFEVCRRLKSNADTEAYPIIFLTARGGIEEIVEGFRLGGIDYVTKPASREEVKARIRTHLERAKLAIALAASNRDLAELNAHLEDLVKERTAQLAFRLKELEGRDRVMQHLQTLHPVEETADLVVTVIVDVLEIDRATLYLLDGDQMIPRAAVGLSDPGKLAPRNESGSVEAAARDAKPFLDASGDADKTGLFSIRHSEELLGMIEVDPESLEEGEAAVLSAFALQAGLEGESANIHRTSTNGKIRSTASSMRRATPSRARNSWKT